MNSDVEFITVNELNNYIKKQFEEDDYLRKVYLKGEISNFKHHSSGHMYFTLKDDDARISAVMFASSARKLSIEVEDGLKVLAVGRISVYPATGQYQIYVEEMEADGLGNLHIEFEKLKKKLSAEGLFDPEHKKKLPSIPNKIGIITAPTGAAIRDILSTLKRRWPLTKTILFPALVQGENSEESLIENFRKAQEFDVDVIIIGRGGGSIEDMWSFNSESLAREIYASKIPVISAVGHEVDFTICDFVADVRAATPTGAAELAVPSQLNFYTYLEQTYSRLNKTIDGILELKKEKLNALMDSYVLKNPKNIYEGYIQKLDTLVYKYENSFKNLVFEKINAFDIIENKLKISIAKYMDQKISVFDRLITRIEAYSPLNTMKRGYSVIIKEGKIIKSTNKLKKGDEVSLKLSDGDLKAEIL